jgi:hexulose-6-phosphate isomerase
MQAMARRACDAGIELASVCAQVRNQPKDIMTNDRAIWEGSLDTIRRCLDATAALGVGTMLLTLGSLTDELYYNEAYANSVKALQLLAPFAEELEVNIAIEYVWNKFLLSPMEFAHFCDDVASPRVGLFFDTDHLYQTENLFKNIALAGDRKTMKHF